MASFTATRLAEYQDKPVTTFPIDSENATLRQRSSEQDREQARSSSNDNNSKPTDEEKQDGGDEEKQEDEPDMKTPVGFWDHRLHHVKIEAFWKWALTTLILMCFILSVLSIYWATLFHVESKLYHLTVYVVDFDGQAPYNTNTPIVGPTVVQTMLESTNMGPHLGFVNVPAANFQNDPMNVRQAIYNEEAWAAVIINANATSMLYSAVNNANTTYDPIGACQLVFIDSRDDTNW